MMADTVLLMILLSLPHYSDKQKNIQECILFQSKKLSLVRSMQLAMK